MAIQEPTPTAGIVPMFATPSRVLPDDDERWAFELKWDGVRTMAYIDGAHGIRLESRNLNDVTLRYPEVHGIVEQSEGRALVLDGEIVAFDENGRPSFGRLQPRMHLVSNRDVAARMIDTPVVYLIFDVLHIDGMSTRSLPWVERRDALEQLGLAGAHWQVPQAHRGEGEAVLAASRAGGLEGVVAKKLTSTYEPGRRSRDWWKIKNVCRQEFVIGGWLPGGGNRAGRIGALLVGYYDDTGLRFAGKVGTGFTDKELARLVGPSGPLSGKQGLLEPIARDTSPFVDKVPYREARFVEPRLVAEIEFTEWTHTDTLRHPSYKGLRDDKSPEEVVRET